MDFWKFNVLKKGKYEPRSYLTKQRLVFQLKKIFHLLTQDKPIFFLYLGSQTTPPCEEYTYHLVFSKPMKIANCQLKVLRENSLATDEAKQVHSRLTQVNNPDEYDTPDNDITDSKNKGYKKDKRNLNKKSRSGAGGVFSISTIYFDSNLYRYVSKGMRKLMQRGTKGNESEILHDTDNETDENDNELNC
jgi:hypothetical protein